MSLRITAVYLLVAVLSVYAWKDWFKSLCGLILMMAVMEHEDMPKAMFGIQGLNLWNVLFVVICLAWIASRSREGLTWDMPRRIMVLLLMYLGVIVVGVSWAIFDRSHIESYPLKSLISEELINTIKWTLPGVLLFDGCRTRRRVLLALICLFAMYSVITVQVVRRMPPSSVFSSSGAIDDTRTVCQDIGYNACDMSTMLAGVSWAVLAALPLVHRRKYRLMMLATAGLFAYGQALTGGRAGYLAWGATGLALGLLKWRKYVILAPVVVLLLPVVLPGATARMLEGFGRTDVAGQKITDDYRVTAGRTQIWPHVIDKISESPLIGHGRLAMERTGLTEFCGQTYGQSEAFPHPHNMYLETLLDNGIVGSLPIFLFWGTMILYSARLFVSTNRLYSAVGGLALALMLAQLVGGIGAQHFYPRESTMCMWAAMFLSLRLYVEEMRVRMDTIVAESPSEGQLLQPEAAVAFANAGGTAARW
jgi:O-antigen ligase